jgi:tetratricopeptide (TPR) repeat protein
MISIALVIVKKQNYLHNVQSINQKEFLQNHFPKVHRIFGEGAITSLSTDTSNHSPNKMKGLVFISNQPVKYNFSLIKTLLSDPDNEIRLYSFSILSQAESKLNDKITQTLKELENTKNLYIRSELMETLACYHWEFIHYGLSDTETEKMILDKVIYYANLALEQQPKNARIHFLLGKVLFYQKSYVYASRYFQKALDYGIPKACYAPYLAEIAYNHKEFKNIKNLFSKMNPLETSTLIASVHKQWIE